MGHDHDERFTSKILRNADDGEAFTPIVWEFDAISHDRLAEVSSARAPFRWRHCLRELMTILLTLFVASVIWDAVWAAPCYVLPIGVVVGWYATAS